MKNHLNYIILLATVIFCLIEKTNAQPLEVVLNESTFTRSIMWYVDNTQTFLSSISNVQPRIKLNGIVLVELRTKKDSLYRVRRGSTDVFDMINKGEIEYTIAMVGPNFLEQRPPTLYCTYEGIPIVIYTGIESFLQPNMKMLREFKRAILDKGQGFVVVPGIKVYDISIDNQSDEFKHRELFQH